jgi:hypothetical protein
MAYARITKGIITSLRELLILLSLEKKLFASFIGSVLKCT